MERDEAVQAIMRTGKTAEQAEAFLDLLGSAFRRRGWVAGEPLSQEQIGRKLDVFLSGDSTEGGKPERTIEDGFGSEWVKCDRPDCDLQVVRPGKVQCNRCDNACPGCGRPEIPLGSLGLCGDCEGKPS